MSEIVETFHDFGLDDRLLKAIAKQGWSKPTLIQEKAIGIILDGRDVLVRARTGSGKTAAFVIPLIQLILRRKETYECQDIKGLILAPTIELCHQIASVINNLTGSCAEMIRSVDLASQMSLSCQKVLLNERPDLVISTPTKLLKVINAGCINLKDNLEFLIIDEADLMFSFGYENDFKQLIQHFPKTCQSVLASATLGEDVNNLKGLILNSPVILKLNEPELPPSSQLMHYHIKAEERDKAAILYALLKLHLINGKIIIFVNTVDKCYKLKLFLEQFKISTCVLNSELPSNIRCHSVMQFNEGLYDIIIATDENQLRSLDNKTKDEMSKRNKDKESGVSRGIDFQFVTNIINFDFPYSVKSYIHRAGRTARGNNTGNVLSFVSVHENKLLKNVVEFLKEKESDATVFKDYNFKLEEIEAFRYRAQDAWKAVTRFAIREARLKEIKQEIFNSKVLKNYFQENPHDLKVLRHDKVLHAVKKQPHLAHIPDYIVPPTLKKLSGLSDRPKKRKITDQYSSKNKKKHAREQNPLFGMQFAGINLNNNSNKQKKKRIK